MTYFLFALVQGFGIALMIYGFTKLATHAVYDASQEIKRKNQTQIEKDKNQY